ncbi:MAG: alkyl hydroperoxide reductase/thiol specific antioxidant/Mal allergen [Myxococcales bacterium]|nr:alkyl hydroperoxide reductase/thiol specific antioxidant/Mal allergen [Myxococcales bacterium]
MRALTVAVVLLTGCASAEPIRLTPPAPRALSSIEAHADLDGAVVGASEQPTIVIVFASWCEHCRDELAVLESMRGSDVRIVGVNYKGHEEYDARGSSAAVRAFVHDHASWLRVVPIDDDVFSALGRPPLIPTMFVYDRHRALIETFDRRTRRPPTKAELETLLAKLRA